MERSGCRDSVGLCRFVPLARCSPRYFGQNHRTHRRGGSSRKSALLLSGVVVNLVSAAAVLTIQYAADPNDALRILRWMIGSLDVVGVAPVGRMLIVLVPAWLALLALSRELAFLLAIDEDTAATLGVNVRRCEGDGSYGLFILIVGVTVATGGAIGFVGLIVPHAVRLMFGEDLRIVLPGSLLLGAAFLVLADARWRERRFLGANCRLCGAHHRVALEGRRFFGCCGGVSSIRLCEEIVSKSEENVK